jgi:ABC-type nitrate/sulfonate/bicarbonate transport system substrate-binding protein
MSDVSDQMEEVVKLLQRMMKYARDNPEKWEKILASLPAPSLVAKRCLYGSARNAERA